MLHRKNKKSIRFAALKLLLQMLADIPNESQDLVDCLGFGIDYSPWTDAGVTHKYPHDMNGMRLPILLFTNSALPLLPRDTKIIDIHEAKAGSTKEETLEMMDNVADWVIAPSYRAHLLARWTYFVKAILSNVFPRLCKKYGIVPTDSGISDSLAL